MAFSFCCAPLLAVRIMRNRHKVPNAPGSNGRLRLAFPDRFGSESQAGFSPPTVIGGYRARRSQVIEKCPSNGAKHDGNLRQNGRRKTPAAEFEQSRIRANPNSSKANFAGGWSDQALALLSTARSERSA
jgi:hypothetical protein